MMDLFDANLKQDLINRLKSEFIHPHSKRLPQWFKEISQETLEEYHKKQVKQATKKLHRLYSAPLTKPSNKSCYDISPMENAHLLPSSAGLISNSLHKNNEDQDVIATTSKRNGLENDGKGQNYLEKSWQSLSNFPQTQRGRLTKKNFIDQYKTTNNDLERHDLNQQKSYSITGLISYTPTLLENEEFKYIDDLKNKRGKSSDVPFYVYANIKKATDPNSTFTITPGDLFGSLDYTLKNKSKSTGNISEVRMATNNRLGYVYNNYLDGNSDNYYRSGLDKLLNQPGIDKRFEEYRQKVSTNIEGILNLSGRISAKLRDNYTKKMLPASQHDKRSPHNRPKTKSIHSLPISLHPPEDSDNEEPPPFVIPFLPTGKHLKINILSTWGDKHYVGLNGVEIFGCDGRMINVKHIRASPSDVNVLPENNNDPRVVENLLDGINRTQDDVHLWLAPFTFGAKHEIFLEFENFAKVAMIRIWNYNKSRIHSYRGVKDLIMSLDSTIIFKGEIAKACGGILGGVDAFGDTILFTIDEHILELISRNDKSFSSLISDQNVDGDLLDFERPPTVALQKERPITGLSNTSSSISQKLNEEKVQNANKNILLGLTGLEILGESDEPLELTGENLRCSFKMKQDILERLVNKENFTTDSKNMWSVPFLENEGVVLSIIFNELVYISGIRVWNYNENLQMSYSGVHSLKIVADFKPLTKNTLEDDIFLLRRAPGNLHYDFVQEIIFTDNTSMTTTQESLSPIFIPLSLSNSILYESPAMPDGFVYQIIIFSTWGDQYYCGLNGIELYNDKGKKIRLDESNICAYPESLNVLKDVQYDVRIPLKLVDGENSDLSGVHSWLAPIIPKCLNRIYIVFDEPVTISIIKIWNYSKTPSRGVKEFAVLVDDLLVYNGILDVYSSERIPNCSLILFAENKTIVEKEVDSISKSVQFQQDLLVLNENKGNNEQSKNPDQSLRPYTSVNLLNSNFVK